MLYGSSSYKPAIHRAQPVTIRREIRLIALGHPRYALQIQCARGVDNCYESPRTEPKLQGCTKDHATVVMQIWDERT